ncbi:invasin [Brachyspira catarrhinii]|uniref:Invasin n=1 Tax=Brachyspira catarrhinii TaxID=2528966 RepID=A0ABY2TT87_9SPIR|nr:invasin [Brachyspira catarrhinii]TKZ35818.1 invasin [Brachyspira catarrhinii]
MKKYLLLIFICLASNLFAVSPKGLYLSPKFMFSHDANNVYIKDNGSKGYYNYLGLSVALGYGITTENTVSPVRLEFEYSIGKAVGINDNILFHTLLGTVYYDINFFFTDIEINEDSKSNILKNQYPLFSIFLGFSIGTKINTQLNRKIDLNIDTQNTVADNKLNVSRSAVVFGFSGGFSFNIRSWLAVDMGYRFIIDVTPRWYHEVLLGLRFTIPKL